MWGKPKLEIHCKECKKETSIDVPEKVECEHCGEEIELKGAFIKGFGKKVVLATVIASGIAVTQVDDVLYPNHYPSEVQYAIIQACIAGDEGTYFSDAEIRKKREICQCAFDNAREDVGYEAFQDNSNYFVSALRREIRRCN